LNEASKKAIAKVQDQMKKDGKAFVGGGLGWDLFTMVTFALSTS
jgi:hypothetical protein